MTATRMAKPGSRNQPKIDSTSSCPFDVSRPLLEIVTGAIGRKKNPPILWPKPRQPDLAVPGAVSTRVATGANAFAVSAKSAFWARLS